MNPGWRRGLRIAGWLLIAVSTAALFALVYLLAVDVHVIAATDGRTDCGSVLAPEALDGFDEFACDALLAENVTWAWIAGPVALGAALLGVVVLLVVGVRKRTGRRAA